MKNFKQRYLPYILFVLIIGVIIALDQVLKVVFDGASFSLIGDFLWIQSTINTGAAFSFGAGSSTAMIIFLVLSFLVLAFILYIIIARKISTGLYFRITLAVLTGGLIGNLIDRLAFGYVRDFIYFKSIGFAIFNIADAALTIACIMLVIWVIFLYKPNNKQDGEKHE